MPTTGDWVAAVYDKKWHIGKVLEVDSQDRDAHNFRALLASHKSET